MRPLLLAGCLWLAGTAGADEPPVDFNRDVRPILSDYCFQCHGPDASERQADLRLDTSAGALGPRDNGPAVVPGQPDQSPLLQRILAADEAERMPPPDTQRRVSPEAVATLRRWIAQGAAWQEHWSFLPPATPAPPTVARRDWVHNPIDAYVLARLEQAGLAPSPPADKTTLLRRVTLDLTGLPPTPAELGAFLADARPGAYERVVERLLASPRHGERMTALWLDAARYADTSGYQNDGPRQMWRWRDWVIAAFNAGQPFDEFTTEQLAGDLLPQPTLEQRIATGFNRNHRGNSEGGIIPEEFAVEYVVDRVDTTATVWLGLTMGCARCHEHKYDPISQREFYQLFAYFNNVPEHGRAIKEGNSPPYIPAPTPQQAADLQHLADRVTASRQHFESLQPGIAAEQQRWESSLGKPTCDFDLTDGLVAHLPLNGTPQENAALRFPQGEPPFVGGRRGSAVELQGGRFLEVGDAAKFGYFDKFSISLWLEPAGTPHGVVVSRMIDAPRAEGYYLEFVEGRLQVNLVKRWLDDAIRVETAQPLAGDRWQHVLVTYDGSRLASGVRVYVDGAAVPLQVSLDYLNQTFAADAPLRIGGGGGPEGRFRGRLDDVRIYDRVLSAEEAGILATAETLTELAALPAEQRSPAQAAKLRRAYLEHFAEPAVQAAYRELVHSERQYAAYREALPTVMIMQELPSPRPTFVLKRGRYDQPGEPVTPGVPSCLPPLARDLPANRLGLARWLMDPAHPLTGRVIVNRCWQLFFGEGLVRTMEDFGAQGQRPTHPELLDWLATELPRRDWDLKVLQRLIVTSATYRQSARLTPELLARDPENRLLARFPRVRLPAGIMRDQALAVSGLLHEQLGGPSVRPYQPEGLWKEIATDVDYPQDHGAALYRRSIYTYWKRTVAPPAMVTFDAPTRETCTVRESRTNTPLQALTLLNETTFVEAARVLAQRTLREAEPTDEARVAWAFQLATSRPPRPTELQVLLAGLAEHRAEFTAHPEAAQQLLGHSGEYPVDDRWPPPELAAYTAVANLILNLDEVVTKQ